MKVLWKILKYLIMTILGFFLIVNVYIIVSKTIFKVSVPEVFGFSMFKVETGSMEPSINIGDIVIVKKTDASKYDIGQVVTYYGANSKTFTVTHEIINREGDIITAKGTANNTADEPFDVSRIIGKVVLIIPGMGDFIEFLRTPLGILCIVAIGFLIIEVPNWIDDFKEKRKKKKSINNY